MVLIIGTILVILSSIGIFIAGVVLSNNWEWDLLGCVLIVLGITFFVIGILFGVSLMGIEGDNRELYKKMQQEYIIINQYIKSDKSDSLLESQDMMNRVKEYNDTLIKKQNDMTRPIMKYWTVGADWNELQLIELEEK